MIFSRGWFVFRREGYLFLFFLHFQGDIVNIWQGLTVESVLIELL